MSASSFEELDYGETELGELILRRRAVRLLNGADVFEVKLDGTFLMSSLVNQAEMALATFALPLVTATECDVLVGGLGLGYTAKAALDFSHVRSVAVIEYLDRVIAWHRRKLVPLGERLTGDPRCSMIHGDFFGAVGGDGLLEANGLDRFHAILLDIDHSPGSLLRAEHGAFYTDKGLRRMAEYLHDGGVFALWSADPPDEAFVGMMEGVFARVEVRESRFDNLLLDKEDVNYILIAQAE